MQDEEDILKIPLSSSPSNKGKPFYSSFDQLSKEYREKFGSTIDITGNLSNNPLHARPSLKGEAFDIRTKNKTPEQQAWIDKRSKELGLSVLTASGNESWASGPHKHLQESNEIRIPLASNAITQPNQQPQDFRNAFKEKMARSPYNQHITPEKVTRLKKYLKAPPETPEQLDIRNEQIRKKLGVEQEQIPGAAELAQGEKPLYQQAGEMALGVIPQVAEVASTLMSMSDTDFNSGMEAIKKIWKMGGTENEAAKAEEIAARKGYDPNKFQVAILKDPEVAQHFLASLVPVFGPMASEGLEKFKRGDIAGGLLTTSMLLAPMFSHAFPKGKFTAVAESPTARVVDFLEKNGITPETRAKAAEIVKENKPEAFVPPEASTTPTTPTTTVTPVEVATATTPVVETPEVIKIPTTETAKATTTKPPEVAQLVKRAEELGSTGGANFVSLPLEEAINLIGKDKLLELKDSGHVGIATEAPPYTVTVDRELSPLTLAINESLSIKDSMTRAEIVAELKSRGQAFSKGTKADLALKLAKARQAKPMAAELPGMPGGAPELKPTVDIKEQTKINNLANEIEKSMTVHQMQDELGEPHTKMIGKKGYKASIAKRLAEQRLKAKPTETVIKPSDEARFDDMWSLIATRGSDALNYAKKKGITPAEEAFISEAMKRTKNGSNMFVEGAQKAAIEAYQKASKTVETPVVESTPTTPATYTQLSPDLQIEIEQFKQNPQDTKPEVVQLKNGFKLKSDYYVSRTLYSTYDEASRAADTIWEATRPKTSTTATPIEGLTDKQYENLGMMGYDKATVDKMSPDTRQSLLRVWDEDFAKAWEEEQAKSKSEAPKGSTSPTEPTDVAQRIANAQDKYTNGQMLTPEELQLLKDNNLTVPTYTTKAPVETASIPSPMEKVLGEDKTTTPSNLPEDATITGVNGDNYKVKLPDGTYTEVPKSSVSLPRVEPAPSGGGKYRVRTENGATKNYNSIEEAQARLQEELDHAKTVADFKERQTTQRGSGGPSTEDLIDMGKIALHFIKNGVEDFVEFSKRMIETIGKIDESTLRKLFNDAMVRTGKADESQLKEYNMGLNPISAIQDFDNLNIPSTSPKAPTPVAPGGVGPVQPPGSFAVKRGIREGIRGFTSKFGSPLSRAGQPGEYELTDPIWGKAASDLVRNTEYNIQELEVRWGKSLDTINHNLDEAYKQTSGGNTLFPKGLKKLGNPSTLRDAFTKDFVDLIEKDFNDPSRIAVANSQTPLGEALRTHDALTDEWRQYIIHAQRELGRVIPDDWGITEKGYYRHLFLGDIRMFEDGKFFGVAPTYAEAQKIAFEKWKTNPSANITAEAKNVFAGDPTLRLSNKKFWGLLGRIKKTIDQNNPLVTISADDLRADMVGVVGREAARQKSFGALFKREDSVGFSEDYTKVMKIHSAQLANSQEISKLNHSIQPILDQLKSQKVGLPGLAEDIQDHINHIWGIPTKSELQFGDFIRKTPILRNHVANPDFALRSAAWRIGRINNFLNLDWNLRSASVNRFQPLTTLWPYVSSKQYASYEATMLKPSTWTRLKDLDVLRGKPKVELGASMGTNPFTIASEYNRGVGYLHGEWDAARLGMTDPREVHRWAMDWAERVEFNNSKWNVAPILRSPYAKILGQYKGYLLKDIENIQHTFRNTPVEPQGRGLRISKQLFARAATGGVNTILKATPMIAGYKVLSALSTQFESIGMSEKKAKDFAEALMFGAPSLIGLDLSGSFSLVDLFGNSTMETLANFFAGPSVGKAVKLYDNRENPEKLLKALTPYTKAANLPETLTGKDIHPIDAVTGKGPLTTPKENTSDLDANYKLQLSNYEAIMEALGYTIKEKSLYYLMKEAKVNPRSGEHSLQRPRRDKRLLDRVVQ